MSGSPSGCNSSSPAAAPHIDRLFAKGRVSSWRFRRMWRHLGECEACRAYYDRAAVVWRQMGRHGEPPQIAEARAQALLDSLPREAVRRRSPWWVLGPTGALAAAALVVGLRWMGPTGNGTFTERGGTAGGARDRGVRAFCVARSPSGEASIRAQVAAVRVGSTPVPELRCHLGDELQFAYTLGAGEAEYLALIGRDESGHIHPYRYGAPTPALRADAHDEPLDGSVRLGVNHHAGRVHVEVIFSAAPSSASATARQQLDVVIEP